jgi:predicted RNase H-like nuclease
MKRLIIGFDSAWTAGNYGAIVGLLQVGDRRFVELDEPEVVNFEEAKTLIDKLQHKHSTGQTVIFIDQPAIVRNERGSRQAETIVASSVGRRYGGVQPASKSRLGMFDSAAPIWCFLEKFGGPADPLSPVANSSVFEVYPVLAAIALDWTLDDPGQRPSGRLPKYNPDRPRFLADDWQHVCNKLSYEFKRRKLFKISRWIASVAQLKEPTKKHQDKLDACICLLVAVHFLEGKSCLMVGDLESGYIVAPNKNELCAELAVHCRKRKWRPEDRIHTFALPPACQCSGNSHV